MPVCPICGKQFEVKRKNQKRCSTACTKEYVRLYGYSYRDNNREHIKQLNRMLYEKRAAKYTKSQRKDIEFINREAQACGMTYGEYVSKIDGINSSIRGGRS